MVLAEGISIPDSMILVASRILRLAIAKAIHHHIQFCRWHLSVGSENPRIAYHV